MILEIIYYILAALMAGVTFGWAWMIKTAIIEDRVSPQLDNIRPDKTLRVSVILPARNEKDHITECLQTLARQDYENLEIIAIDDSSEDDTGNIIAKLASKYNNIVHVSPDPKPQDWIGKNWACVKGVEKASGELLLFTDADARYEPDLVSRSVANMLKYELDALTVIPRLRCLEFWTSVTLPMITTFLHTTFSPKKVNDPKTKMGYFFGSFFMIKRKVYEAVGGHEGTKYEIIEDGALGRKVKNEGYKMRMVKGRKLMDAVWARTLHEQWHALKRIIIPIVIQNKKRAIGMVIGVAFLMFIPMILVGYSIGLYFYDIPSYPLLISSVSALSIMGIAAVVNSNLVRLNPVFAIFSPIGGAIVTLGLLAGLSTARSSSVTWRGRKYTTNDCSQGTMSV